ncbi:MAG: TA system VapC family ribonuclease toxin [Polyangiaceae bacterium]
MIAVDANILVYAHRADSPWNEAAAACLDELAGRRSTWGIPWPCVYEFYAIVTHPRVYAPPSSPLQAVDQLDAWFEAPELTLLSEESSHWHELKEQLVHGKVSGRLVHDARIAALCIAHGVDELWTADRDFSRYPQLRTRNPLLDPV